MDRIISFSTSKSSLRTLPKVLNWKGSISARLMQLWILQGNLNRCEYQNNYRETLQAHDSISTYLCVACRCEWTAQSTWLPDPNVGLLRHFEDHSKCKHSRTYAILYAPRPHPISFFPSLFSLTALVPPPSPAWAPWSPNRRKRTRAMWRRLLGSGSFRYEVLKASYFWI